MRKFGFFAVALAAISFASCTAQAPKAEFKNEIDSLSYMFGVANTQGLDYYISGQLGVDTTYMADFIAGVVAGVNQNTPKDVAYNAGLQIGQQITGRIIEGINNQLFAGDSTQALNQDNFIAGFVSALKKKPGMVTPEEASAYVQTHADAIKAKALEAKYGENKAAGIKFLEENKTKEGVITTESGLQYKVIKAGNGEFPTKESSVKVNYKGTLIDGTEFDSSYKRNAPATFRADQVIKGWTEALTMMPVGSKWELYIPQELAYGSRETGGLIKPFSTLIFEVELLEIEKKK